MFSMKLSWNPAPISLSFFLNSARSPLLSPWREMTNSANDLSLMATEEEKERKEEE